MKKELSPPQTIAIVAVFLVVVVTFGWWWMNRTPGASTESALGGGGTMPITAPGQPIGGDANTPGNSPSLVKPDV